MYPSDDESTLKSNMMEALSKHGGVVLYKKLIRIVTISDNGECRLETPTARPVIKSVEFDGSAWCVDGIHILIAGPYNNIETESVNILKKYLNEHRNLGSDVVDLIGSFLQEPAKPYRHDISMFLRQHIITFIKHDAHHKRYH